MIWFILIPAAILATIHQLIENGKHKRIMNNGGYLVSTTEKGTCEIPVLVREFHDRVAKKAEQNTMTRYSDYKRTLSQKINYAKQEVKAEFKPVQERNVVETESLF